LALKEEGEAKRKKRKKEGGESLGGLSSPLRRYTTIPSSHLVDLTATASFDGKGRKKEKENSITAMLQRRPSIFLFLQLLDLQFPGSARRGKGEGKGEKGRVLAPPGHVLRSSLLTYSG